MGLRGDDVMRGADWHCLLNVDWHFFVECYTTTLFLLLPHCYPFFVIIIYFYIFLGSSIVIGVLVC